MAEKEPRPIAWVGFPEDEPTPKYDVIYDGTTQLPGYIYKPIWDPKDHPVAQRARKGEALQ